MSSWTDGYVAEITYTYGYYPELNPMRARLPLLNQRLAVPKFETSCELGFGQGVSISVHACASATKWSGNDFNPAHTAFARDMTQAAHTEANLSDEAFAEFCLREDLPDFDFIGLHGIWSWISDDNRSAIRDFIKRKLKVGGVLYISYNTQPGWAAMLPMRDLLAEHSRVMGAPGDGMVTRVNEALDFATRLLATEPQYTRFNPFIGERLKKIGEQNRNYVAHEYFNQDWHPMSFAKMAEWLTPAKLQFACSANLIDHVDQLNLSADQIALLGGISDPLFRQSVRDFCVNQQFRKDYWIKGARQIDQVTQITAMRALRVLLIMPRADITLKVKGGIGEASLKEEVYAPVLDVLADHRVRTIGDIEQATAAQGLVFAQVAQAIMVLYGMGAVDLAQDESSTEQAAERTQKLNRYFCELARGNADMAYLASPVTGGAIRIERLPLLFMLARANGAKGPADWAAFTWNILQMQGQRLVKDGVQVDSADDNLAMLTAQASAFEQKILPVLLALRATP